MRNWVYLGESPSECVENITLLKNGKSSTLFDEFVKKNNIREILSKEKENLGLYGFLELDKPDISDREPSQIPRIDFTDFLVSEGVFSSLEVAYNSLREIGMSLAKNRLRDQSEARDRYVVQAIHAIDDMDRVFNLVSNRVYEWYMVHFPELFDFVRDNLQFCRLVRLGSKENFIAENLSELSEKRRDRILEAKEVSLGSKLAEEDIKPIQQLASFGVEISRVRDQLDNYIDGIMTGIAPNIAALVGGRLGARLIASAGSLENLAKKPSSTMQVLGAEKALFRSLKEGSKPPKHGFLFQSPLVHRAPIHQRGKIARLLAGKLSIAARVDHFSGSFIADELQKAIETRINEISTIYSEPPRKKKPTGLGRQEISRRSRQRRKRRPERPKKKR